eukprot:2151441-Prymnesium_polylepis.1
MRRAVAECATWSQSARVTVLLVIWGGGPSPHGKLRDTAGACRWCQGHALAWRLSGFYVLEVQEENTML